MAYYGEARRNSGINSVSAQYNRTAQRTGSAVLERKRSVEKVRTGNTVIIKKKVKEKTPFPVGFIFYSLIVTVMLMFIAYSYSVVNNISYEIGELEESIAVNKQENERLSLELDKKNDLTYIENVAVNKLGMVKSTQVVKHYVNISGGDKVVITKENQNSDTFGVTLDGLKNTVSKIYQ